MEMDGDARSNLYYRDTQNVHGPVDPYVPRFGSIASTVSVAESESSVTSGACFSSESASNFEIQQDLANGYSNARRASWFVLFSPFLRSYTEFFLHLDYMILQYRLNDGHVLQPRHAQRFTFFFTASARNSKTTRCTPATAAPSSADANQQEQRAGIGIPTCELALFFSC